MEVGSVERALGSGALAGLVGLHLPVLADLPPDVRSMVWGAIGAALSALVARAARGLGRVVDAAAARAARRIDPAGTEEAPEGAEGDGAER